MIEIKLIGKAIMKTPGMLAIFISSIPILIGSLTRYESALEIGLLIFMIGVLLSLNDDMKEGLL